MAVRSLTGTIVGYDPGGNGRHGVATFSVDRGQATRVYTNTRATAEDVLLELTAIDDLIGIGVDTLTCWSTGESGWRAADLWLREKYPEISNSVAASNSLFGSMGINGMAVLVSARQQYPEIHITETHPKVLYWAMSNRKHDYGQSSQLMDSQVSEWMGISVKTRNDHEWDAAISAYAALAGLRGEWTRDLLASGEGESARRVLPCGQAHYWWPV